MSIRKYIVTQMLCEVYSENDKEENKHIEMWKHKNPAG